MYDADYKKPYVATYKEIFTAFVIFVAILIFLYPKDLLHKQLLSRTANYDLSILYLKDMLKSDPSNETLMLQLANKCLIGDKRDLAYTLLKKLKKSKKRSIRSKAYALEYKITKEDYFQALEKGEKEKAELLHKKLYDINHYIVLNGLYSKKDLSKLYRESIFLEDKEMAYRISQDIVRNNPMEVLSLESAYYLATNLHHYDDALRYAVQLSKVDYQHKEKWDEAQYYLLYNYFPANNTVKFLEKRAQHSFKWANRLAQFYLFKKEYQKASQTYKMLLEKSTAYNKKFYYWKMAIESLQAGGYLKEADSLGSEYENYFLRDKQARTFLLKVYLATDNLKKADNLAKKILKLKEKRQ